MAVYSDYSKARPGWFLGLNGKQLLALALASAPVVWAGSEQQWSAAAVLAMVAAVVAVLTIVPVRGRSAAGWVWSGLMTTLGAVTGWSIFTSRAAAGRADPDVDEPDLPGALGGIELHEGPPSGIGGRRVALVQNHPVRTWAATASVVHQGLGLRELVEREHMGRGLADLADQLARAGLVEDLLFVVRTVPDDPAARDQWVERHRRGTSPARQVNDDLNRWLTAASVQTESFCTVVVPESRLAREARGSGRGIPARAAVLDTVMADVETTLKGSVGARSAVWLTSPELAATVRTGFAPADRASIADAALARAAGGQVAADVPWPLAGPSGAYPTPGYYVHDMWLSVSSSVRLPRTGAVMGALAPVLVPKVPGERRAMLAAYPIVPQEKAARQAANEGWATDVNRSVRRRMGMRDTTQVQDAAARAGSKEAKQSRGSALCVPYGVVTSTVPRPVAAAGEQRSADATAAAEARRRLDGDVRRAGFSPLALYQAADVAFFASVLPVGLSLTRDVSQ